MVGLPGSGKTRLARALEAQGYLRVCPDEEMFRRHGRYGLDFPRGSYLVRERPILDELGVAVGASLRSGTSVVFDHGLWTPAEREEWRAIAHRAGAVPVLVYLPVPHDELWQRIRVRNDDWARDPNSIFFSEEDLRRFAGRFFPPLSEEVHLIYDGRPERIIASLNSGRLDGCHETPAAESDSGVPDCQQRV
nr:ATP-binding protein [Streptomyces sp. NRRL B-24484]